MRYREILVTAAALPALYFAAGPGTARALVDHWWAFPLTFGLFLAFAAGLLGWGALAERRWGGGAAGALLYASAFAVAFAFVLGHLGLLRYRLPFFAYLALGGWWLSGSRAPGWIRPPGRWVTALFAFVLGLRFLTAFLPERHGDPLLYHLAGPALWRNRGAVHIDPDLPNAILAATWEYLYVWPQVIWNQTSSAAELIAAQVFSQWLHLAFGWIGIALIARELAKRVAMEDRWRFLFPLAALFVASLQWTAGVAKNDAGVAFWSLGAWWFFTRGLEAKNRAPLLWAGIFAGLAVTAKISAVIFLVPTIGITWAFFSARNAAGGARSLGLFVPAFLLALAPIYLRNWAETGSPFFPMFQKYFPSPWVSASWEAHFSAVQPNEALSPWRMLMERKDQLLKEAVSICGWLLLPLLAFRRYRRGLAAQAAPLGSAAAAFLLFSFGFTAHAELRYLGASLVFLALGGLLLLVRALEEFVPAGKARAAAYSLPLLAVLAGSKLPTHLLWKLRKTPVGEAALLTHTAGDAKAWLRANTPPGALVVMVGDNESYYLLGVRATVLTERPDLDRATRAARDLPAFVEAVCRVSGGTYLLESRSQMGLHLRFPGEVLARAVAFQGAGSRVYDLRRLERIVLGEGSRNCGRVPAPQFSIGAM